MSRPDCVIKIDTSILDGKEVDWNKIRAYVYQYKILEGRYINCKYTGSRKMKTLSERPFDGSYWGSSTSDEFKDLFSSGTKMELKLLDIGTYEDMLNLEHELQKEKNVIKNPEYFNKAVTKTAWKEPLNKAIADFLYRDVKKYDEMIKNPEDYTKEDLKTMELNLDFKIDLWDKLYLKTLGYVQVREKENARHITDIAGYMRDKGDALGANYILIWESDLRIGNGNCTLKAALLVDSITKCKVIIIPEWFEKLHKLEERDRRHIGNLFNKINKERTDEISKGDVIKDLIYDYQHHKIPFDSKRNKDLLVQDYGFHINTANSIIKDSEIEHKRKQQKSTYRTAIIYNKKTHPDDYDNLIKKETELSDENTLVITGSSGGWKSLYVQTHEEIIKNLDKQHIICLIHHGDGLKADPVENREKWDGNTTTKGKKERFEPIMKHIVENLKSITKKDKFGNPFKVKRTFRIEYMPFDKADSK